MEENGNIAELPNGADTALEINEALKDVHLNGNDDADDDPFYAPFEILAEFLSALMIRDYRTALHYCKLILQYEPENTTVQEFYPLIEHKIKIEAENSADSNDQSESSEDSSGKRETDGSTEYYSSASNDEGKADTATTSSDSSLSSESEVDDEDNRK